MLALDVHDEHRIRLAVQIADTVQADVQAIQLAAEHRLLLFHELSHAPIGLHCLEFDHPLNRFADGIQIGHHASQPTFASVRLAGCFGSFLDADLGLFLGTDKQHLAALCNDALKKVRSPVNLGRCLDEVDDVDSVASLEDVFLHLRVPLTRLVAKVHTRVQQFFYVTHSFFSFCCRLSPKYSRPAEIRDSVYCD